MKVLYTFPPVNRALLASKQDFATLTNPHSCLVAMLIVTYHPWLQQMSILQVPAAQKDTHMKETNRCTARGWSSYIRLTAS